MAKAKKEEAEQKDLFQLLLEKLEKDYGSGTVISGKQVTEKLEVVSTGSLSLDLALGTGGWPVGCLIELFGMESAGKSTIALHACSEFQKIGKVAFVNGEHAFDRLYATNLNVKVDDLIILNPNCQEDMYNMVEELIKSKEIRLIVIDSHTSVLPKLVMENKVGDATIALSARNNSIALGKLKPLMKPNRCSIIAIAQMRTAIGKMYGEINVPSGGNAYRFYSDIRCNIWKSVDKEKEINKTTVEVVKSKVSCPFGVAKFIVSGGRGIDRQLEVIDLAVEYNLIKYTSKGGWYNLLDDKNGDGTKIQGASAMKEFLADNEEFAKKLEQDVINKIRQ